MAQVGVRELKAHLSRYLQRAAAGERIVVTDRGTPVAVLTPAAGGSLETRVEEILRTGVASWAGGIPQGARRPPRIHGPTVADAVIEDRR
jgi:prevent-host-death family protein